MHSRVLQSSQGSAYSPTPSAPSQGLTRSLTPQPLPPTPTFKLTLAGAHDLHRYFVANSDRLDDIKSQNQDRASAAEVAWLVTGSHNDGNHMVNCDTFHAAQLLQIQESRSRLPREQWRNTLKTLLWDVVSFYLHPPFPTLLIALPLLRPSHSIVRRGVVPLSCTLIALVARKLQSHPRPISSSYTFHLISLKSTPSTKLR